MERIFSIRSYRIIFSDRKTGIHRLYPVISMKMTLISIKIHLKGDESCFAKKKKNEFPPFCKRNITKYLPQIFQRLTFFYVDASIIRLRDPFDFFTKEIFK